MCRRRIRSVQRRSLDIRPPPGIIILVGSPMKSRGHDVVAALRIRIVVPARFGDIDFARLGPRPVRIVDGQHPDGGPEPVSGRQLGSYLDAAIFDGGALFRVDAPRPDGLHDGSVADICDGDAVGRDVRGARAIRRQIDDCVALDEFSVLQRRHDDEFAVLDEDVLIVVSGLLKFSVAVISRQPASHMILSTRRAYPKPPTSTSFVQTSELNPPVKSSLYTGQ